MQKIGCTTCVVAIHPLKNIDPGPRSRLFEDHGADFWRKVDCWSSQQNSIYCIEYAWICLCMKILFEDLCVKCEAFSYHIPSFIWGVCLGRYKIHQNTRARHHFIIVSYVTLAAVQGREAKVVRRLHLSLLSCSFQSYPALKCNITKLFVKKSNSSPNISWRICEWLQLWWSCEWCFSRSNPCSSERWKQ